MTEKGYLYTVEDDKQVLEHKRVFVDSKNSNQPRDAEYWHEDTHASNTGPIVVQSKGKPIGCCFGLILEDVL